MQSIGVSHSIAARYFQNLKSIQIVTLVKIFCWNLPVNSLAVIIHARTVPCDLGRRSQMLSQGISISLSGVGPRTSNVR